MESQFSILKYNVNILETVGVEKHFGGLLSWFSLELYFAASIWELTLAWRLGRHLSLRGTTLHGATLYSLQSFLLWPFFNCIISFSVFPARIQKYLKLSVSLAFHLLPFPQTKETKKTNSFFVFLFLYQTVELPSTQVLSTCAPTGATRSFPKLFLWPLPTCPSLYQIHPSSLHFSSGVTPAGNVPGIHNQSSLPTCMSPWCCTFPITAVIMKTVTALNILFFLTRSFS